MPLRRASARRAASPRRELRGRSGAGGGHGRQDAARLVRRARHARHELVAAIAGEHQVGVAVDEAGDDAAAGGVDALVAGRAARLDRLRPCRPR